MSGIIWRVKVYLSTTHLVTFKHQRRRVNVNRNQILTTIFGIAKSMNVRDVCTGDGSGRTLAAIVVTQTLFVIESENGFPHQTLLNSHDSVRAVVIMNRCLLAWSPTDHQHLDRSIAANSMTPIITFLETDVRLEVAAKISTFAIQELICSRDGG